MTCGRLLGVRHTAFCWRSLIQDTVRLCCYHSSAKNSSQLLTHNSTTNSQFKNKLTSQQPTHNSTTNSQFKNKLTVNYQPTTQPQTNQQQKVSFQPTTQPQTHKSTTNLEVSLRPSRQQHSNYSSSTNSQISRTCISNNQLKTRNLTKS